MRLPWKLAAAALLLVAGCEDLPGVRDQLSKPPADDEPELPEPEPPRRVDAYALECLDITGIPDRYGNKIHHKWTNVCAKDIVVFFCQDSFESVGGGKDGWGLSGTMADCGSPFFGTAGLSVPYYTPE